MVLVAVEVAVVLVVGMDGGAGGSICRSFSSFLDYCKLLLLRFAAAIAGAFAAADA